MGRFADALIIFRKSLKLSQQFAEAATDNLKEQYNLFIDFWRISPDRTRFPRLYRRD
jgi:hypothetical protein